ncbi:putative Ig domain-containing protein [Luteimonas sp. SJ-92]|uniref:Putative Ig domain-containing protein n=1 Tax=Luteimonas salinisoli TaxID=2752307 RepID=A0A853JEH7_9GAMM|nr:putative Ig domain-containing protein [Luteimonas salinisoli]NZA27741.1 putative Ig domain-containing protein [Luteimonas salinisoli]
MHQNTGFGPCGRGRARFARACAWLLAALLLWPALAFGQSAYCPTLSATVANGGSVDIDVSHCDGPFDFGMSEPWDGFEQQHGHVSIGPNSGNVQFVTYVHNGDDATSDTFYLEDNEGDIVTVNITIEAPTSAIVVTPESLPTLTAGTAVSQTLTASGGVAPYNYSVASGALPVGLSLNSSGLLSGTPTQRGVYSFSVQAQDNVGDSTVKGYTGTVQNPTLTLTTATGTAVQGSAINQTLETTGGVAPYSYLLETGTLPAGISISAAGVVSGTTNAAVGSYPVTLRVTDSSTGPGQYFELETYTIEVVALPSLSINDVAMAEGNAGTASMTFTVSLDAPAGPGGVTFDIATADGTATAGSDYVSHSLTGQTIAAGASTYSFAVQIGGDTLHEPDETFFVNVTNVTGATVADAQGTGTINNDDPLPSLAIDDVSVTEGNAGTVTATFTVALSAASGQTVSVGYATADGTATAGSDYAATSGTLTITAGQTQGTISVTVNGDTTPEPDETFTVGLSGATNASIADGTGTGTILNDDVPVSVTPATLPDAAVAAAYSQALGATGGSGPYTFAITAGALPAGLTLAADGTLSGTPTAGGSFNFTVTATDSSAAPGPYTGSRAYTLTVAAATVTLPAASLPAGTRDEPYATVVGPATGGTPGYTYAVTAGALPAGLTLAANGALSGTPTALGTFNFTVTATDSSTGTGPYTGSQAFSIVIADQVPVANPVSVTVAYGSTANPVPLDIDSGAPTNVSVASLPAHGVAAASGTQITYTPTTGFAGTDSFTYTATNASGTSAPATVTVTVTAPAITVTSGALAATVGSAYSVDFNWNGGQAPYVNYQVLGLPAGLSVTASGSTSVTVSGTPAEAGTFALTVSATDSSTGDGPFTTTENFSLAVAAPTLALAPAGTTFAASYGQPFSQAFTASGGVGPYLYALSGTAVPGLTLSADGTLSGTPTTPGSYGFDITATDSGASGAGAPYSVTESYTVTVGSPAIVVAPATLPDGAAGQPYGATFAASGGVAPYAYTLAAGSLPAGLQLAADGSLSGTPTASGSTSFTVLATDDNGQTGATAYTLEIGVPTLTIAPATLPDGVAGSAYTQTVSASGGIAPYSYVLGGGPLPAGLTFDAATGALAGTPTETGSFAFTVTATDSTSGTAGTGSVAYTLVIAAADLALAPDTLPGAVAGVAYSQAFSASGGVAPYAYALAGGALPAGLSLAADGTLSGTPTASGSFAFQVEATDSAGGTPASLTLSYTLEVAAPQIVLAPDELPDATRGSAYAQALGADGGTAPYTFALSSGALPAGLALAADGSLSGTPTVDGEFAFGITATDALGFTGSAAYALRVSSAAPVAADDTATTLGGAAVTIAVTDNDSGAIDSLAIDAAPAHGSAEIDGLGIVYTPAADFSGTDSFRYTATGPGGTSAPATVTVTVNPLPVAVSRSVDVIAGQTVEVELTESATGGPFTAATLLSLTPAAAGSASIASEGSGDSARYVLSFAADAAFAGQAGARFTLDNAHATSAEAVITFNVVQRPDPTQDPEVRALLEAQVAATRRFAGAQIANFQQRLERLHRGGETAPRFSNQLGFSAGRPQCVQPVGAVPGQACDHARHGIDAPGAASEPAAAAGSAPAQTGAGGGMSLWVGGAIRSGHQGRDGTGTGTDFESDGLSVGADYRLSPAFAVGAGLGWGRDDSEVGERDSRSEGEAWSLAAYGSYHPGETFFVDALLGYQTLSYDLRRRVTASGGLVHGTRDGRQWFGSVSAGADIRLRDGLQLTPYARLDLARGRLDGYVEQGDDPGALRHGAMDVDTTTGNVGLRLDFRSKTSWGVFAPLLRMEYQHDFQGDASATMGYADLLTGPLYRTTLDGFDRNRLMLGIGAMFGHDSGVSTRIEYRGVVGNGSDRDHGLLLNIEKSY